MLTSLKKIPLLLSIAVLATGCATNTPTGPVHDPYQNINRKIYSFNTALDNAVLKPAAKAYRFILPDIVETGVRNFFSNLDDVNVIANDLLQGKFKQAGSDTGRFLYNTTAGIFGIWDVSTRAGIMKHNESFGQTLGVWGVGEGPFLMLPLLGPNNIRSTVGGFVESATTDVPNRVIDHSQTETAFTVVQILSLRASLLSAGNLFDAAALDPYLLLRDFWVQRHRLATWDGKRPVAIGEAGSSTGSDELDELDELDALDELDELDELDALDELDELDRLDALD